jgi:hypothetical protein
MTKEFLVEYLEQLKRYCKDWWMGHSSNYYAALEYIDFNYSISEWDGLQFDEIKFSTEVVIKLKIEDKPRTFKHLRMSIDIVDGITYSKAYRLIFDRLHRQMLFGKEWGNLGQILLGNVRADGDFLSQYKESCPTLRELCDDREWIEPLWKKYNDETKADIRNPETKNNKKLK